MAATRSHLQPSSVRAGRPRRGAHARAQRKAPARPPRGRGYRLATPIPPEPSRLDVLAGVYEARQTAGRRHEFDSRLETSCCASIAYLWRLGRYGQAWARQGTGTYATTLLQLTIGLAPIMGWTGIPDAEDLEGREKFLRRHRASVQRWLDWLAQTGLVDHEPETLENGQWYRTRVILKPCAVWPTHVLERVVDRDRSWRKRERRRQARGRRRNLSAILRRSRLSRAERRARGVANRRRRQAYQQAQRVAERAACEEHLSHLGPPIEPWTTSQGSSDFQSSDNRRDRGNTRERDCQQPHDQSSKTNGKGAGEGERPGPALSPGLSVLQTLLGRRYQGLDLSTPDGRRWQTYHEVMAGRDALSEHNIERRLAGQRRRRARLLGWDSDELPELWWLAELFVSSTYEPETAALPGGFRLAFLSNDREQAMLAAAARVYRRASAGQALPPGFPENPVAGFAHWLVHHAKPQDNGPERGIAADLDDFATMCRQARAYAKWTHAEHRQRAARRAGRRRELAALAAQVNKRLSFRLELGPDAKLKRASELLDSEHPAHQAVGRALYHAASTEQRLADRDRALISGRHPGWSDGAYTAACKHADRWGLPGPDQQLRTNAAAAAIATVERLRRDK